MFANVGQKNPAERIFRLWISDCGLRIGQTHLSRNLISFLSILFEKHDVPPGRCTKVAGVVVGISRPGEAVVWNLVPFFARDFASFTADANARVGEETNLDAILHIRMLPLIRALDSFADHRLSTFPCSPWPPASGPGEAPGGGCSGCRFGGPSCGTYFLIHSLNAGPRGNRPGTMLQASALASMIVTFGSPEIGTKSLVASPRTGPAEPK